MDTATIEATNRIRLSLGMKPLPVPGIEASQHAAQNAASDSENGEAASTLESRQAQAYENYKGHMEAETAKKRREEKTAAIRKARDNAQRLATLEGKGLGDADQGTDMDAKAWLMGQKKRQKRIEKARKLEEELAAAEAAAAQAVQYTSKDLAGIKVAHDTSAFVEGDEQILTLKDATIDENEEGDDELENINLRDHEKLNERLELQKKRPGYNPQDEEGGERGILSQYDEEISGKKTKKFTLDSDGAIAELSDVLDQPAQRTNKLQNVSLDDIVAGDGPASSDYVVPSEIKIKKPKKRKSKGMRQKQRDEGDILSLKPAEADDGAMDLDRNETTNNKRKANTDALVEDEDLQALLSIQRKQALKKRRKTRPEDIAKQLKHQEDEFEEEGDAQDGGLVIGEISEFVAGLRKHDDEDEQRRQRAATRTETKSPEAQQDHPMGDADSFGGSKVLTAGEIAQVSDTEDDNKFDQEKSVGEGMGAALALLRERGLIGESRGNSSHQSHRDRQEFLKRRRQLETELDDKARQQRERDRAGGKLDHMSRAEREDYARQQNAWRDHQHSRKMADLITSNYKPNVDLKYTDEYGRQLDQKEAFKHLSHQFHGKGSGKGKTEKKLKQIEDEKRRNAQSLFDANQSGGMNAAAAQQLKKHKEAGVRLG